MKKNPFILIILVFLNISLNAMSWQVSTKDEFLSAYGKAADWFAQNQNYNVDIVYMSFSNHTTLTPYDKSEGYYKRNSNNFSSSAMGVNTIQNDKMKITVDESNEIIVLSNKTEISQSTIDKKKFAELLENSKSLKKMTGAAGEKIFRLEFKPNDLYSAYEFSVNAKGLLTGMKYFYSKEMKEDEHNKTSASGKPRVEIKFSNYNTESNFDYEKEFSEKKYVTISGNKVSPNDSHKNFELKDYRVADKK